MSSESTTARIVKDLTGMWWPAADADKLRSAADAWTAMATALDGVTATSNTAAQSVIGGNHGPAIDSFQTFWERYYKAGQGWLPDSAAACRQMAKALNDFAAQVDKAVHQLEEEAVIVGATLVAGAALAFFTAGLSEAAAGAATAAIVSAAEAIGVTVSETIASIAATTLTGVAFGAVESATVDIAVAQPVRIAFGDGGFSETELLSAAETGGMAGGLTSGLGAGARALSNSADGAAGASTALAGIGRIADGLGTLPGRRATGAALGAGQDALLNGGNVNGLDILTGVQNQVWMEIVQIALDLLAWMPMLALTSTVRRWEPKRLRLRPFSAAARLVTTGRRGILRLARHWPWTDVITTALSRLQALPNPGRPAPTTHTDEQLNAFGAVEPDAQPTR